MNSWSYTFVHKLYIFFLKKKGKGGGKKKIILPIHYFNKYLSATGTCYLHMVKYKPGIHSKTLDLIAHIPVA